jgi:small-conductance mechanosensitive channel
MNWSSLPEHVIHGLLILATSVLGLVLVYLLSKRAVSHAASLERLPEARRRQLVTLVHALRWVASVVILGHALLMVLSSFGVNITPLLTSAGVAGLAISLAAQSLIKDFIGGVLVLTENQYAVGDTIQIGTVSGQVEGITLRATHVRAPDGSLYIVPNGQVQIVANQTRDR